MVETDWYSDENATFGDRLAGARDAAQLSQADLARRLGIKLKTLKAWENDLSEPRANRLQMVAGLLNVSIVWLLTGQGDGVEPPDALEAPEPGLSDVLLELRQIRNDAKALSERAGRLEKMLRQRSAS